MRSVFLFNLLAFAASLTWWCCRIPLPHAYDLEPAIFLMFCVVAFNAALCYAALTEIDGGVFAGISFSAMFALPLLGFTTFDVTHIDPYFGVLAALAVAIASSFYACRYYTLRLRQLLQGHNP